MIDMKKTKKLNLREEILKAVSNPSTVTEIKNKIPEIKSFGTLAYHLKKLKTDGIITKKKEENKQGQPTKYKLQSLKEIERLEKWREERKKEKIIFLEFLKKNELVEDNDMLNRLELEGHDLDFMGDASMSCVGDKLATLHFKITPKGKKFLKENKK
jgi:DNA-binding PadR family transcriptional regulator